ncbi:MAG: SDR family NAD(P)-dependent oxidoreductase [Myxococcales bacterium]|jgi:NAD(P)-dependent dehydrogenase (short-subunit alcohol dehydrogenase family)
MDDLKGKVAVVTGGASGIGFAMAERFGEEGARVVLADIESGALAGAVEALRAKDIEAMGVECDVSKLPSVQNLLARTLEAHGRVNILCNNAGVQIAGPTWQITIGQWEWILGVNVWGVIHGVHVFVPQMLEQGDECHIVNTSSMAGLISVPMMSAYQVTKHAVVTLSESLSAELAQQEAKIGVSVLCPAFVQTNLHRAERNRPEALRDGSAMSAGLEKAIQDSVEQLVTGGKPPRVVADAVLEAVRSGQLYVLTHPEVVPVFEKRAEIIVNAARAASE